MSILSISAATDSKAVLPDYLTGLNVESMMETLGPETLNDRGVLSKQVNMQRMSNNPVGFGADDIATVFRL